MGADSRLSTRRCPHTCCVAPYEPTHLHLFDTSVCPDCNALDLEASVARHPANHREELEP